MLEDPDVANDPPFVHWTIYNIPPGQTALPEGMPGQPRLLVPEGANQGRTSRDHRLFRHAAAQGRSGASTTMCKYSLWTACSICRMGRAAISCRGNAGPHPRERRARRYL